MGTTSFISNVSEKYVDLFEAAMVNRQKMSVGVWAAFVSERGEEGSGEGRRGKRRGGERRGSLNIAGRTKPLMPLHSHSFG